MLTMFKQSAGRRKVWGRTRAASAVAGGVLIALAAAGCASSGSANPSPGATVDFEPVTLRYAVALPESEPPAIAMLAWQEEVTEKTGGAVTFENYFSGSLLPGKEMLSGVQSGTADLAFTNAATFPQELPANLWLGGMGVMGGSSPLRSLAAQSIASYEALMAEGPLRTEFEALGITPLGTTSSPAYALFCTSPIANAEDAKGKIVRTAGPLWDEAVVALGMTPVSIPYAEVYEGLQRGVADCATLAFVSYFSLGLGEIAPYYIPLPLPLVNSNQLIINSDTWNNLAPEVRQIMHDAFATYFHVAIHEYLVDMQAGYEAYLSEPASTTVLVPEDLVRRAELFNEGYLERMTEEAPSTVRDPDAMVSEFEDSLRHWNDIMTELGFAPDPRSADDVIAAYAGIEDQDLEGLVQRFADESIAAVDPNAGR